MIRIIYKEEGCSIPATPWCWMNEVLLEFSDDDNLLRRRISDEWGIHTFLSKVAHLCGEMEQERVSDDDVEQECSTEDEAASPGLSVDSGHTTEEPDEQHDSDDGQPEVVSVEAAHNEATEPRRRVAEHQDDLEYIEVEYV